MLHRISSILICHKKHNLISHSELSSSSRPAASSVRFRLNNRVTPLRTISKVLLLYKALLYDINYIIMLYHEFHFMFLCIFVEAFYGFKMVMFIKLKKRLICF